MTAKLRNRAVNRLWRSGEAGASSDAEVALALRHRPPRHGHQPCDDTVAPATAWIIGRRLRGEPAHAPSAAPPMVALWSL